MHKVVKAFSLLLVAAPVLAFTWAYGGARADVLARVMPWACALCAFGTLLLPMRRHDESWGAAERRVCIGMLKDPCFWIACVLFAYLLVPLFNVSLCPTCDWRAIDAGADPYPPYRFLPFCANPGEHVGLLWLFGPSLLAALGVRHGLTGGGRRVLLEVLVWNGAALAMLGFVQLATGAKLPYWEKTAGEAPYFFSVFGYPNMGGAFFTLMFALSFGLWLCRMGQAENLSINAEKEGVRHLFLRTNYPFFGVALNLCGLLGTLCRAAMVFAFALSAIFFFYVILRAFSGNDWRRGRRFRNAVVSGALMLGLFAAIYVYAPAEVGVELGTVSPRAAIDRTAGKGQYHTRVATKIMRDFPFFGVGGWGYRHFAHAYMTPDELQKRQSRGGANVHNDYLQFLAEHGIVGFSLMLAFVWLLAAPSGRAWKTAAGKAIAAGRSGIGASTLVLYAVSPAVVWSFLGCLAVLVHAFSDCPLRSGAVLASLFVVIPASFGFLHHMSSKD